MLMQIIYGCYIVSRKLILMQHADVNHSRKSPPG